MNRILACCVVIIMAFLGVNTLVAKTASSVQSMAYLDAALLIVKKGKHVEFSSKCQSNLKRAGFTLFYTRNVQLHSVDDDYNDILVRAKEMNYVKVGVMVRLYYLSKDSTPVSIEIEFPTQASRNNFFTSLRKLGFSGSGTAYIATPSGMMVDATGNTVSISYML